jgi:enoyl-CoA hydratase/3-hydroxyacyl-CoA dehydrogenase
MKIIKNVGVVGAGSMGAALAQKFAQENFNVILADREMAFVEKGLGNISKMLNEGVEKKVFTTEQVAKYLSSIKGTATLQDLKDCDLVVEAIFENFDAKSDLFKNLSEVLKSDAIIATNTSSFSISELAQSVKNPERFIGLHYFYHAAKNRLVEIIPGEKSSDDAIESAKIFSVQSGKDAISCRDAYGFVVNRFFVPWLNESARLLEENVANIPTIDDVCMKAFGIGMGPFALMNATGVPVAYHSEKTLEVYGPLYTVSQKLKEQTEIKQEWDLSGSISEDEILRKKISDRMFGVVFLVCAQLLDEKVCRAVDINRGARIGLQWKKGPIEMMQKIGSDAVKKLIAVVADFYHTEKPKSVGDEFWKMSYVDLQKKNGIAVITMSRPEDLNALNEEVMQQLDAQFSDADADANIETIFITGTGKAFVAGADIKFFVNHIKKNTINEIETFTAYGQKVCMKIDNSKKHVVALINGLALGGGLELALCADTLLATPKAMMAFPETGIGIYPGLGGTQRSAKKIGKPLAKYLIHTGKMLSANDACDMGLIDAIISTEDVPAFFSGSKSVPVKKEIHLNEKLKNIQDFFEQNSTEKILAHTFAANGIKEDEAEKLYTTIKRKAPIAVHIADKLIQEAKGCDSELTHLKEIFSTKDALLGLTSIGKKVEYSGE